MSQNSSHEGEKEVFMAKHRQGKQNSVFWSRYAKRERRSYYLNKMFNIGLHVSAVSLYNNFSLSRQTSERQRKPRNFWVARKRKNVSRDFPDGASCLHVSKTLPDTSNEFYDPRQFFLLCLCRVCLGSFSVGQIEGAQNFLDFQLFFLLTISHHKTVANFAIRHPRND